MAILPKRNEKQGDLLTLTQVQDAICQLAYSRRSNQALLASTLIGRTAIVADNVIKLTANTVSMVFIDIPLDNQTVMIIIYTKSGDIIRRIWLQSHVAGLFEFNWDGLNDQAQPASLGEYLINVKCNQAGQEYQLKTMTAANIDSVTLEKNGQGITLNVAGVGALSLAQIQQVTANSYLIIN